MLHNYLKIAYRNLLRHKGFSFINIMGLAIGMSCCLLILEYVFFEISYDQFNKNREQIYKVHTQHYLNGKLGRTVTYGSHGLGLVMKKDFPEVEDYARLTWAGNLIKYVRGANLQPRNIEFVLSGYSNADTVAAVGSFNGWNHKENLMKKENGIWKARLSLHPNTYEYKIYVDGKYLLDPANPDTLHTYGNVNSLLHVKPVKMGDKEVILDVDKTFYADASVFSFFTFPIIKGTAEALDKPNTTLISETTAKNLFGNEDPIDKTIIVDGSPGGTENYLVKGVFKDIPKNSHLKMNIVFSLKNALSWPMYKDSWDWDNFFTYLKVKNGANIEKLQEGFKTINKTYFPGTLEKGHILEYPLISLEDIHLFSTADGEFEGDGKYENVLYLSLIVTLILIIAYVNYINLTSIRSMDRAKEVGVRKATGASKGSLIRQFLLESFLLSLLAFVISIFIVLLIQPFFNQLVNEQLFLWETGNYRFWGLILLVFVIGAILSGLYPAILISSFKTITALKGRIKSSSGLYLRKGLVVMQFAASIALITGTFVVYRQINFMKAQDLGFEKEQILILNGPQKSLTGFDSRLKRFKSDLLNLSSVEAFSASSSVPSKGISWGTSDVRREADPSTVSNDFEFYWVDDEFLSLYELEVVAGQGFSKKLSPEENGIILTETACKRLGFNSPEDALHQIIVMEQNKAKVLGVIRDYHHSSLRDKYHPMILVYKPMTKQYFSVKINGTDIKQTIGSIEAKFNEVFPGNTVSYYFLDEEFNKQYKYEITFGKIFGLFSSLAIVVACLGLFGLTTFSLLQRTKEIGVRKVLGASVANLWILLTKDFVKLVLIANLVGLPLAFYFIKKWLENYAFKIPISWWIFAIPSALILMITLITISFQTIKTARENPVKALKYE